jgi:hypothetical protein
MTGDGDDGVSRFDGAPACKLAARGCTPKLARLVLALALVLAVVGCLDPRGEKPGYRLAGDLVETRIENWRFTNAIDEVFIQTRPWYLIPHSATIWCVALDQHLYIGSYGPGGKKRWELDILRNPNARLRIAGKIYDVRVQPVADAAITTAIDAAYAKKYDMAAVFENDVPEWWYYEVVLRDP